METEKWWFSEGDVAEQMKAWHEHINDSCEIIVYGDLSGSEETIRQALEGRRCYVTGDVHYTDAPCTPEEVERVRALLRPNPAYATRKP